MKQSPKTPNRTLTTFEAFGNSFANIYWCIFMRYAARNRYEKQEICCSRQTQMGSRGYMMNSVQAQRGPPLYNFTRRLWKDLTGGEGIRFSNQLFGIVAVRVFCPSNRWPELTARNKGVTVLT